MGQGGILPAGRCTQPAWPIDNRPQATSLPHIAGDRKIVAAREQTKM
jgi:hypothetical protein